MRIDEGLKAQLARELCAITKGWTLLQIATRTGVHPSHVSEIRNGKLAGVSIARLVRMIAALDYNIEIAIKPIPRPVITRQGPTTTVRRY